MKAKNWQGEAKVRGKGWRERKLQTRKNVLPYPTSQMRKIKPLKKLRCKPQGSEVFHCGSMGIYAKRVDPQVTNLKVSSDHDRVSEGLGEFQDDDAYLHSLKV
jgi:hypothetical protein